VLLAGCGSQRPARVPIPDWDPPGFADAILPKLDTNGDGLIDQRELNTAPGLAAGARRIDSDRDGKLSRDELAARFAKYRDRQLGLTSKEFRVTHNGRPLVGAEVRLVPEFFLNDVIEPATGTTIGQGIVRPSVAGQPMALLAPGYYRVEVTSPSGKLAPMFNSATNLGVEVSPFSDEAAASDTAEIQLHDRK
jgi:hypothetical protein